MKKSTFRKLPRTGHAWVKLLGTVAIAFIASWSAIRFNKAYKDFYEGLKERGNPSKGALIAVANKLIRQVFAIVRDNTFYVDGHISKLEVSS